MKKWSVNRCVQKLVIGKVGFKGKKFKILGVNYKFRF